MGRGNLGHIPEHKFWRMLLSGWNYSQDYRRRNTDHYRYYDGDQWNADEKAALELRGQQATVLNIVRPMVDLIINLQQQRRVDHQIVGREIDDGELAHILTKLLKQVFDEAQYGYFETQMFRDGLIGGIGWMQIDVEEDRMGENQIVVHKIPWEEVYYDPFARRPDLTDARFIIRQIWMDRDQAQARWPEKAEEIRLEFDFIMNAVIDDFDGHEQEAQLSGLSNVPLNKFVNVETRRVSVHDTWYTTGDGEMKHVVFMHRLFLEGGEEDSQNENPLKINHYPLIPYIAGRNRIGEPQGLVHFLMSYQDAINKAESKHIWAISARQALIEEDAVDDPETVRQELGKADGLIVLRSGALQAGKAQILDHAQESNQLVNNINLLLAMAQRTAGVNDASFGQGGVNVRSAQQETQRLLQGAAMQSQFLENLFFTKRAASNVILRLIGEFYKTKRVVRITAPNGFTDFITINEKFINTIQDELTGQETQEVKEFSMDDILRFDVLIKEVSPFTTVSENTISQIVEAAKSGVIHPQIAGKVIIGLSDIPNKDEILREMAVLEQQLAAQEAAGGGQQA